MSEHGTERVGYDEISFAFVGEEIEREGIIAQVEAVKSAATDPRDDDARYTLEVRTRSVNSDAEEGSGR